MTLYASFISKHFIKTEVCVYKPVIGACYYIRICQILFNILINVDTIFDVSGGLKMYRFDLKRDRLNKYIYIFIM